MNWRPFDKKKPKEGQSIIFANWRGVGYCHNYSEIDNAGIKYAWQDATHWFPADLPERPKNIKDMWNNLPAKPPNENND